jgi:hypothetical protein
LCEFPKIFQKLWKIVSWPVSSPWNLPSIEPAKMRLLFRRSGSLRPAPRWSPARRVSTGTRPPSVPQPPRGSGSWPPANRVVASSRPAGATRQNRRTPRGLAHGRLNKLVNGRPTDRQTTRGTEVGRRPRKMFRLRDLLLTTGCPPFTRRDRQSRSETGPCRNQIARVNPAPRRPRPIST